MTPDLKNGEVKQEHLKKVSICSVCKSENIRWSRYKNNYFGIFLVPHISRPLFLYLILWKIIAFSQNKHLQRVGEQEIKTISSNSIEARKIEDFLLSIISSPNIAGKPKNFCLAALDCQMCIVPDSPNKVYPQNPVPSSHFSFSGAQYSLFLEQMHSWY